MPEDQAFNYVVPGTRELNLDTLVVRGDQAWLQLVIEYQDILMKHKNEKILTLVKEKDLLVASKNEIETEKDSLKTRNEYLELRSDDLETQVNYLRDKLSKRETNLAF